MSGQKEPTGCSVTISVDPPNALSPAVKKALEDTISYATSSFWRITYPKLCQKHGEKAIIKGATK